MTMMYITATTIVITTTLQRPLVTFLLFIIVELDTTILTTETPKTIMTAIV